MNDPRSTARRSAVDRVRDAKVDSYRVVGLPLTELTELTDLTDLARLAAQVVGVPAAAVNLMRSGDQTTVAAYGTGTEVCAREEAMCAAILNDGRSVRVADASLDPRWADNPYVSGQRNTFRLNV